MYRFALMMLFGTLLVMPALGQASQPRSERRPALSAVGGSGTSKPQADDGSVFVLNGLPMLLTLHHDTEVGTGNPIDIYELVIEMQVMNSDGDLEPVGLQIHNYYTAKPQDRKNDINPRNARDCRSWVGHVVHELKHRDPNQRLWPYLELVTNTDARVVQTNEHGPAWFSDDIQCWGSMDRFPPF